MAEFFGHNRNKVRNDFRPFRNMVDDPYLYAHANGMDYENCCGLAATGDEVVPAETVKDKVINLKTWNYAKTGLALVGAYVVLKFLFDKFKG